MYFSFPNMWAITTWKLPNISIGKVVFITKASTANAENTKLNEQKDQNHLPRKYFNFLS